MRPRMIHFFAGAALLAASVVPARAQSLARRVHDAGGGEVRFSFAAQPDVCGDGENIARLREGDRQRVDFIRQRNGFRVSRTDDAAWLGRCDFGPLHITLDVRGDRIDDARLRVGRDPGPAARDLGYVRAADAVDYLLGDVVPRASKNAAQEIILAAVLADSAEAWPALLDIGRNERIAKEIRSNAVFWVGQAAAEKATAGLASMAGDEAEDLDLRKHALFALSQRPRDEGVPALIDVARTSRERELVKTALFWLGQSNDSRALELFKDILVR
jgi:hypothetical protein